MSCMRWNGRHRKSDGRPVVGKKYVYRMRWEQKYGPIPTGSVVHHTCGNSWCVNLRHLRLLSQGDHLREHRLPGDWGQRYKTHCPAGHPYDEHNTYVFIRADGVVERHCRACRLEAKRRYNAKQKFL